MAYLSEAPKSTRAYEAYKRAEVVVKEHPSLPVPIQVRNAPTGLMQQLGYGDGYHYQPDYRHAQLNDVTLRFLLTSSYAGTQSRTTTFPIRSRT